MCLLTHGVLINFAILNIDFASCKVFIDRLTICFMQIDTLTLQDEQCIYYLAHFIIESRYSCWAGDGRAWKVNGRTQALVGQGVAIYTTAM